MHQAILARAPEQAATIAHASLRFIRSCSAALPPRVMADLESAFGASVIEAYGMTEAAHQMASNPLPPGIRKPGSVGVADSAQVAIMAQEDDALLAPGEVGEVVIRGPNLMGGYVNAPEANARAFASGWFRTGDQGRMDRDGYLYLAGRIKEIINRGGEKISPREIDEVLLEHPAVAQAVAFAMPDADLGEEAAAAVVLRTPGVTELDLRRHAAQRLAPFKVPRHIAIVEEIPKGPTGKIQRLGLAARLGLDATLADEAPGDAPHVPPSTDAESLLAALWTQVLKRTELGVHERFVDLGGDSILATQLVARLRQTLGIELTLVDFFEAPTIAQQALLIERLLLDEIEALSDDDAARQAFAEGAEA